MNELELPGNWRELPQEKKERLLWRLKWDWNLYARPDQREPDWDFFVLLLLSGRGAGKTRMSSEWVKEKARLFPGVYISIFGATYNTCKKVNFEGPSGLLSVVPPEEIALYNRTELLLKFKNGSRVQGFSSDNPDRIRGSECGYMVLDELASYTNPQDLWDQAMLTLRSPLVPRPRALVTTTPRPIPIIKRLIKRSEGPDRDVALVRVSTFVNTALPESVRKEFEQRWGQSALGRQELYGEIVDDLEQALWHRFLFDEHRRDHAPDLNRVIIGVDPAVTAKEDSDETGIVVLGIGVDGHGYVTNDASGRYKPNEWAEIVCGLYRGLQADVIVAEVNQGGEMVMNTIHTVDPHANVQMVRASRGKWIRAEPVAALYAQGRIHHVGEYPKMEDQACAFVPGDFKGSSPDRVDALVWAATEGFLEHGTGETEYVLPPSPEKAPVGSFEHRFGLRIPAPGLSGKRF